MKKTISLAVAALMAASSVAVAAQSTAKLTDFSGRVLVNSGNGFVAATANTVLSPGDKVMVGENSFAVLAYADCAVSVSAPSVVAIAKNAPCVAGAGSDTVVVQPVAGGIPPIPVPVLVIGTIGLAVGTAWALGAFDDKSVSP